MIHPTGHTDSAGYCLVTSANHNGMRLISVGEMVRSALELLSARGEDELLVAQQNTLQDPK